MRQRAHGGMCTDGTHLAHAHTMPRPSTPTSPPNWALDELRETLDERQLIACVGSDVSLQAGRLMAAMFPTIMFTINASSIAVLWLGADRIADGQMAVGSLVAYLTYLVQILMAVVMATFMVSMIPRAAVSAERIVEVVPRCRVRKRGREAPVRASRFRRNDAMAGDRLRPAALHPHDERVVRNPAVGHLWQRRQISRPEVSV